MLSNRIWIMPQQNRAGGDETAEVLYRCGSQQGKVATQLPLDCSDADFESASIRFVADQITEYRALRRSKQKNPTRGLKKYFDRDDIRVIEDAADENAEELARRLV
jgi:hypothetical protein